MYRFMSLVFIHPGMVMSTASWKPLAAPATAPRAGPCRADLVASCRSVGSVSSSSCRTSIHSSASSADKRSYAGAPAVSRIFWRAPSRVSALTSRPTSAILRCSLTYAREFGGAAPGCQPPSGARAATLAARAARKSLRAASGSKCSSSGATSSLTRLSLLHAIVGSPRDTRSLP